MSNEEEVKTVELKPKELSEEQQKLSKKQEQERQRMQNEMRRQAQHELNEFKKRIRESNELKELQCNELELNLKYYDLMEKMNELHPRIPEIEAKHNALIQEDIRKEREARDLETKKVEKLKKKTKPDIVQVKQGKPRE